MTTNRKFIRENVIKYFGSQKAVAEYLDIKPQAVQKWAKNEPIPEKQQLKLMLNIPKDFPAH